MNKKHTPIPVLAAKEIAEKYKKSWVIICAYDENSGRLHATTYGISIADKNIAAQAGEMAMQALGADLHKSVFYEDFRKEHGK